MVEVGMSPTGAFVVVWRSSGSFGTDRSETSIQGRIYTSLGVPLGPQGQVNTYTTGSQSNPEVGVDADGNFVVVWRSEYSGGTDTLNSSIQGRIYTSSGVPIGPQAQVNTFTPGVQHAPAVGVGDEGNFVVVWSSSDSDGRDSSATSIHGRLYGSNAAPIDDQFEVNSYTSASQIEPSAGFDGAGNFVVVWQSKGSYESDSDGSSIQAQRFAFPLFADGFESGDTTVWSSSVPGAFSLFGLVQGTVSDQAPELPISKPSLKISPMGAMGPYSTSTTWMLEPIMR
jgi:hypothetical protein